MSEENPTKNTFSILKDKIRGLVLGGFVILLVGGCIFMIPLMAVMGLLFSSESFDQRTEIDAYREGGIPITFEVLEVLGRDKVLYSYQNPETNMLERIEHDHVDTRTVRVGDQHSGYYNAAFTPSILIEDTQWSPDFNYLMGLLMIYTALYMVLGMVLPAGTLPHKNSPSVIPTRQMILIRTFLWQSLLFIPAMMMWYFENIAFGVIAMGITIVAALVAVFNTLDNKNDMLSKWKAYSRFTEKDPEPAFQKIFEKRLVPLGFSKVMALRYHPHPEVKKPYIPKDLLEQNAFQYVFQLEDHTTLVLANDTHHPLSILPIEGVSKRRKRRQHPRLRYIFITQLINKRIVRTTYPSSGTQLQTPLLDLADRESLPRYNQTVQMAFEHHQKRVTADPMASPLKLRKEDSIFELLSDALETIQETIYQRRYSANLIRIAYILFLAIYWWMVMVFSVESYAAWLELLLIYIYPIFLGVLNVIPEILDRPGHFLARLEFK